MFKYLCMNNNTLLYSLWVYACIFWYSHFKDKLSDFNALFTVFSNMWTGDSIARYTKTYHCQLILKRKLTRYMNIFFYVYTQRIVYICLSAEIVCLITAFTSAIDADMITCKAYKYITISNKTVDWHKCNENNYSLHSKYIEDKLLAYTNIFIENDPSQFQELANSNDLLTEVLQTRRGLTKNTVNKTHV